METTTMMRTVVEIGVAHACPQATTVKAGNFSFDKGRTVSDSVYADGRTLGRVVAGNSALAPTAPIKGVVYPLPGDPPV